MGTTDTFNLLPKDTSDIFSSCSEDDLKKLGLFTMENTRNGIKEIMENQMRIIKLYLSSNDNDDETRVYNVEDIQKILGISKNSAYMLIKEAPFRVVHIGNTIRISKADFDRWLDGAEQRRN